MGYLMVWTVKISQDIIFPLSGQYLINKDSCVRQGKVGHEWREKRNEPAGRSLP